MNRLVLCIAMVVLLFCIFITSIGCAPIVKGARKDPLGGKYSYVWELVKPESDEPMRWEDEKIEIAFVISDKTINFKLKNLTETVIKIIWDETVIVQFGEAKRVIHGGVKYTEREEHQPVSVIPPGTRIRDLVLPAENISWRDGYYGRYTSKLGGWEERDLLITRDLNRNDTKKLIYRLKGTTIGLYLPILSQDKTLDYNFEFRVVDVIQEKL